MHMRVVDISHLFPFPCGPVFLCSCVPVLWLDLVRVLVLVPHLVPPIIPILTPIPITRPHLVTAPILIHVPLHAAAAHVHAPVLAPHPHVTPIMHATHHADDLIPPRHVETITKSESESEIGMNHVDLSEMEMSGLGQGPAFIRIA